MGVQTPSGRIYWEDGIHLQEVALLSSRNTDAYIVELTGDDCAPSIVVGELYGNLLLAGRDAPAVANDDHVLDVSFAHEDGTVETLTGGTYTATFLEDDLRIVVTGGMSCTQIHGALEPLCAVLDNPLTVRFRPAPTVDQDDSWFTVVPSPVFTVEGVAACRDTF